MATALYAVRNICGADYDVWDVNVEETYLEEAQQRESGASGDRLVPQRISNEIDRAAISAAFARYDAVALGAAVASVLGLGLLLATAIVLLAGGEPTGPNLSLLGQFLFGYEVSWAGAVVGAIGASLIGFLFGFIVARTINVIIATHERRFLLQADIARSLP
jgi:uncharacterized membrane protein